MAAAHLATRLVLVFPLATCLLWVGCRSRQQSPQRRFDLRGTVVSVDREQHRVTISHQAIPGYMEAMVMPFHVKDEWAYRALAPGARVEATLVVDSGRSWLEDLVITRQAAETQPPAGKGPGEPAVGQAVPDFSLVNQDGRPIHTRQYLGQALLITFIYTRCPLPDYCPLMMKNFAQVDRVLAGAPGTFPRTHLLAVSFDPEFDQPRVLKDYGMAYAVRPGRKAFSTWELCSGTPAQVKEIAEFFGVRYWQEAGQIVHSLRTAVIAPDGKLFKIYRGNDWKPAALLADLQALHAFRPVRPGRD